MSQSRIPSRCFQCAEDCPIRLLDAQAGDRKSGKVVRRNGGGGKIFNGAKGSGVQPDGGYSDSGGPSRFFYSAKVSTKERERGCELLPIKSVREMTGDREEGSAGLDSPRAGAGRTGGAHNHHPTLKPLTLCEWLAKLILPPTDTAVLLVPYCGTGSEIIGALKAGWPAVIGIEKDTEEGYVNILHARVASWCPDVEKLG